MDIGLDKAAKELVDEAALKLDPVLTAAIDHALAGLKDVLSSVLDGRTITITLGGKKNEPISPAPGE